MKLIITRDPRWKSDWRYKVMDLFEQGLSYSQMRPHLGVSAATIHKFLRQQGVLTARLRKQAGLSKPVSIDSVYKNESTFKRKHLTSQQEPTK